MDEAAEDGTCSHSIPQLQPLGVATLSAPPLARGPALPLPEPRPDTTFRAAQWGTGPEKGLLARGLAPLRHTASVWRADFWQRPVPWPAPGSPASPSLEDTRTGGFAVLPGCRGETRSFSPPGAAPQKASRAPE